MKKTKKGFTIVELVIVIAVIAVLAAILIPTFIHLHNKANEAADKSLVTNLNKALAMREAEEGDKGKNMTMHDCVVDLEKEGYRLPQLATRSGEDLVWSQQANRFFLSSEYERDKVEKNYGEKYNCWHIYEQMPQTQEWAIYPNEDKWTTADVENLKVGFDAGKAKVNSVFYNGKSGNKVTIRTNGGTLKIDASSDEVKHFNFVDSVNIIDIAPSSYYEYGTVGSLNIEKGHVYVENGGFIAQANVAGTSSLTTQSDDAVGYLTASENAVIEGTKASVIQRNIEYTSIGDGKYTYTEDSVTKTALFVSTIDELKNALNGTTSLEGITKICLKNDIINEEASEGILYSVTTNSTLDLNGKTLSTTLKVGGANDYLIKVTNNAVFNLQDSLGNGKLFAKTQSGNYGWKGEYVVCVDKGTFNLYSGQLLSDWSEGDQMIGFGVDIYCNGAYDSYFNMYGGSIVTPNDEAIGCRSNNNTGVAYVTIENGYVSGWDGVFMQQQSDKATNHDTLVVNGGTIIGELSPIRIYNSKVASKADQKLINITLNGGHFLSPNENDARKYNDTILMQHPSEVSYTGWEIVNVVDNR